MQALRRIRAEVLVVPLLLGTVALNQVRLSRSASLSPWKGGGFGMFSSVRGPGDRVVQCRAWDAGGREVPVDLLERGPFAKALGYLASVPSQDVLDGLARAVLATEFVPLRTAEDRTLARLQAANPDRPLAIARLLPDRPVYRPLRPADLPLEAGPVLRLSRVELTVREPAWDSDAATLTLRALCTSSSERELAEADDDLAALAPRQEER